MSDSVPLLARHGNAAVVHLPGRAFPALAMQGDTFHIALSDLQQAKRLLVSDPVEAESILESTIERLESLQLFYEDALEKLGVGLPYAK